MDREVAVDAAEMRHEYAIPLADSIIAVTSIRLKALRYTDDPHLFTVLETFLEQARSDWSAAEFYRALAGYLEQMAALVRREKKGWIGLR